MSSDKLARGSNAAKVNAAKRTGRQSHMGRVHASDRLSEKFDKRLEKPQLLDARLYKQQTEGENEALRQNFPTAALGVGHWYRSTPEATDLEILREINNKTGGKSEYGQIMAPTEKLIRAAKDIKAQEENASLLQFGQFLIDSKRPGK